MNLDTKEMFAIVPATILAMATLVSSFRNSRKLNRNTHKLNEIHVRVNGRIDELLRITGEAKLAEGKLHGRQIERDCQRRLSEGKCPIVAIDAAGVPISPTILPDSPRH